MATGQAMGELRDALMEAASALGHAAALAAELEETRPRTVGRSYSIPELAEVTGISEDTLRSAVRAGRIPVFSVTGGPRGNRVRESDWLAIEAEAGEVA